MTRRIFLRRTKMLARRPYSKWRWILWETQLFYLWSEFLNCDVGFFFKVTRLIFICDPTFIGMSEKYIFFCFIIIGMRKEVYNINQKNWGYTWLRFFKLQALNITAWVTELDRERKDQGRSIDETIYENGQDSLQPVFLLIVQPRSTSTSTEVLAKGWHTAFIRSSNWGGSRGWKVQNLGQMSPRLEPKCS